ncbi:hypothetical protein TNCV_219471 [Trichonephila clavipes]|nr:hypothetical protein TNCV_219471 [Trichonephila clavipes]
MAPSATPRYATAPFHMVVTVGWRNARPAYTTASPGALERLHESRFMLNMSRLKSPPVGVMWKLRESGFSLRIVI